MSGSYSSKIFLGGTCNGSNWREQLIPLLSIDYFNPVCEDWTPAHQQEEINQRNLCDFCLYTITPKMTGVFSIAEAVEDSIKRPQKTIFCILECDEDRTFTAHQWKSMLSTAAMIEKNGASVCFSLPEIVTIIQTTSK